MDLVSVAQQGKIWKDTKNLRTEGRQLDLVNAIIVLKLPGAANRWVNGRRHMQPVGLDWLGIKHRT